MRISSTVHYASRLLVNLALHGPHDGPLSASELAEHTGISVKFIEKIIRQLRTAGMVRSVRGAAGGHVLTMNPDDVTLGDVLRVVEGGVQPPNCCVGADCDDAPCRCKAAWTSAAKALEETLDQFTLTDIMHGAERPDDCAHMAPDADKDARPAPSTKLNGNKPLNTPRYGRTPRALRDCNTRTCSHQSQ